jgi:thermitase
MKELRYKLSHLPRNTVMIYLLLALIISSPAIFADAVNSTVKTVNPTDTKKSSEVTTQDKNVNNIFAQFMSWALDANLTESNINLGSAVEKLPLKKEIVVAVVDTGIDPNHPFLKDNVTVIEGSKSATSFGKDFSKNSKNISAPTDEHGHGTHVAGIIRSVFPEVKILALKYYNPSASGQDNLESTVKALRYAVENNVDVINYSGGGPEASSEEKAVLLEAEKKGILVVAAAGNEKSNIDEKQNAYYPASYRLSNILTVTAHDQSLAILSSSNWGKNTVDLSAPGYRIKSSIPDGRAGYMTGTSQSTAFVSGLAAKIKAAYPEMDMKQLKKTIIDAAAKVKSFEGKSASAGKLDANRAATLAGQYSGFKVVQNKLAADKKRAVANKKEKETQQKKVRFFQVQ